MGVDPPIIASSCVSGPVHSMSWCLFFFHDQAKIEKKKVLSELLNKAQQKSPQKEQKMHKSCNLTKKWDKWSNVSDTDANVYQNQIQEGNHTYLI